MENYNSVWIALVALLVACGALIFVCVTPCHAAVQHTPKHKPYADLVCVGQEGKDIGGKVWQVRVNFNARTIKVNRDVFKISSIRQFANHSVALYTPDFISTRNLAVYNAVISDNDRFYLHQYAANKQKYIGGIELVCHEE